MIIIEELFTKPINDVQKEQQKIQKEISLKNKELKDLFSSKYQELLNCTDLLNGISNYTKGIMTITNKTQEQMMKINETNYLQKQVLQHSNKINKSLSYFIKKIKQCHQKGNRYLAYLALKFILNTIVDDNSKLYPFILFEQIKNEFSIDIDTVLIHIEDLDNCQNQLIIQSSQNCILMEKAYQLIDSLNDLSKYQELITLNKSIMDLSLNQIYNLITLNQIPTINIDTHYFEQIEEIIKQSYQNTKQKINEQLIFNICINDQFNHLLFQEIQKSNFTIENTKDEAQIKWIQYYNSNLNQQFREIINMLNNDLFQSKEASLLTYKSYQEKLIQLQQNIQSVQKMNLDCNAYQYDECLKIFQEQSKQLEIVFNNFQCSTFESIFLINIFIYSWKEILNDCYQIKFYENHNEIFDLSLVDSQVQKFFKLDLSKQMICEILKLMFKDLDIQFSLEYRNLVTAIHPEKASQFYKTLFTTQKFNNKSLKRIQIDIDGCEQQSDLTSYSILSIQKSVQKDQANGWVQRAQDVNQTITQSNPQQSRFGLNLFWKKT